MATLIGDGGNNTIVGLAEDDTISGLSGNDSLSGLGGVDVINGDSGDDTLQGGAGNDVVNGGANNDTIIHVFADNTGTINEYDGGADTDTLRLELASSELAELIVDLRALDAQTTSSPGTQFTFTSVNLVVNNFEAIEIVVDGVVVAAEDLPDAADDELTVTESEGVDGVDINVLDNDAATPVVEVSGDAGNIDVAVAGTNGGLFTISADGSTDFNANGEFEGLGAGESAVTEVTYGAEISGVQGKFDIILAQDLSGSFSDDLPNVRAVFSGLFDDLSAGGNDVGFGVASFIDKPIAPFGNSSAGDFAYRTDQAVSTDKAATQATLDALVTRSGSDSDESQLVALQQIALRATDDIGYRDDAQRFVVLQTDADPHVAGDFAAAGPDDGDTDTTELEDYPTVASVGALLNAANISVIFAISPQQTSIAAYQALLADLGVAGTVVPLSPNSSNLSSAIQAALETLASVETATLSVTVTGENDQAVAVGDVAGVGEDDAAPTVIDLTGNDSDPDTNDDLEILSIDTTGTEGTVVVNADNDSVSYDPAGAFEDLAAGETEVDTFTYTVTDGNGSTDTATVSVTVTGANDLPVAAPDSAGVGEDDAAPTVIDLTGNDSDPDGTDDLEILSIDDTGTEGTVTVNPDNDSVTYDPAGAFEDLGEGETEIDTFTYTVTDGNGGTDTETVSVTVTGANDLPVAVDDSVNATDDAATLIDLTGNDSDPDTNDDLEILSIDDTGTLGTVVVNPDNDTVNYDPNGAFSGLGVGETAIDTFTYTITDGNGTTDTATVSVTILSTPELPVAVADTAGVGEDDVAPTVIDLTGNDSDPDGDDLEILSIDDTGTEGTVTVNPDNDSVSYDPAGAFEDLAEGETEIDTFTYTVTDGTGQTDTATVSVTVTGANDLPVATPDSAGVGEDDAAPTVIDLTGNDSDPDGTDDLEILSIDDTGTEGTVTVNPDNDSVTYDPAGAFEDLGEGETEIDTFTYTVTDGNGGTDTETVSVTVTGANDLPVAVDDVANVVNGATVSVDALANDSDPDTNDVLTILSVDTPTRGTASIVAGQIVFDPGADFGTLVAGETDVESVTYTISDGNGETDTATIDITVSGDNTPPVARDDTSIVRQAGTVDIDVLGNDSDVDGDTLTVIEVADPANGVASVNADGTINFAPDFAFFGQETLTYIVSDGRGATATADVTVTVLDNLPPVIQEPVVFFITEVIDPAPGEGALAADLQAFDFELDDITFSIAAGEDGDLFTIDPITGEVSFIAAPDFEDPTDGNADNNYLVNVTVSDVFGSNTQQIEINVLNDVADDPINPPDITSPLPVIAFDPVLQFITSSSTGVLTDVEVEDLDIPNGDVLEFRLVGEDAAEFTINSATGEIALDAPLTDPTGSFDGDAIYEVVVVVEDQFGLSDTQAIDYLLFVGG